MRLIDADKLSNDICFLKYVNGIPATVNYNRPLIDKAQACECIDKQPTIEVPQWIPCRERLPELNKSRSYLVTKTCIDENSVISEVCTEIFWINDNKWDCERDCYSEWEVIAWMPLPQAYAGKESD